ncbi:MAG TPA: GAF domain-containing protein [Anaerolineae bacterium]|nr:GAF domain-containing protein [Anaerolineae bacterium]
MSDSSLQVIVFVLAIAEILLAAFVLWLDPRRSNNVFLSGFLLVFGLSGFGAASLAGAGTVEQALPSMQLIALFGFQIGTGLILITLNLFRPEWLRRWYVGAPLAVLIVAPIALALVDIVFQTRLMFSGLEPAVYAGGYVELPAFLDAPLGRVFRLTNLIGLQIVETGLLILFLVRPAPRRLRGALVILLGIEVFGFLAQVILRNRLDPLAAHIFVQLVIAAGTTLAVFQTGMLSHGKMARLLGWLPDDAPHRPGASPDVRAKLPRRRLSVSFKFGAVVVALVLVIVGAQTWLNLDTVQQQYVAQARQALSRHYHSYQNKLSALQHTAASLALAIADRPDVPELTLRQDRAGLLELLSPLFSRLNADYGVEHLVVEDPNGVVLLRVHDPEQYGDSGAYRPTVKDTLARHETFAGLEIGRDRLGVRGVSPLYDQGSFVGMLEVGLDFDQPFIQDLKARSGADFTLWVTHQAAAPANLQPASDAPASPLPEMFYYAGSDTALPAIPAQNYREVLTTGRPAYVPITQAASTTAMVLLVPLQAYPDRIIGVLQISDSLVSEAIVLQQNQGTTLVVAAGLALLSFAIVWVVSNVVVLRPLGALTRTALRQLGGDATARAHIVTGDEFQQLSITFNTLSDQADHSRQNLEGLVADRTRELERRSNYLEASASVGRAVASMAAPDQLLREVVNLIGDRFGLYYVAVFTLDQAGKFAVLREATGDAGQILKERGHKLEVGGVSMVGYATAQRKPRIALDVGQEAVRFANPLLPETRSEAALPLVVGNQVIGALDVQSVEEAAFDEAGIAVLQNMADQVAIALANAQSFEALQVTLQWTSRLYGLSRRLSAAASLPEAYAALSEAWIAMPYVDRASLFTVSGRDMDGEPVEYELAAEWSVIGGAQIDAGARYTPEQLPLAGLAHSDRHVVIRDAADPALPGSARRVLQQAEAGAALLIPMVARGRFEGLVVATAQQAVRFADGDVQFVQTMAEQLSVIIDGLRAGQETKAALARVETLNRRLSGEAWRAYLVSRLDDVVAESGNLPDPQAASRMAAPIVVRGETLGTLILEDADASRQWTEEEWELLNAVAGEVALTIDNARLIEQMQMRAARESRLNQISEKIRRAADIESILSIAAEELSQALDTSHASARLGRRNGG